MSRYVLVTGDFVKTGGMDRANYALAHHLAERGDEVHLVGHRADEDLRSHPCVVMHQVPKPLNSYFLSAPLLARAGRRVARGFAPGGARVVVNGGNCSWGDVNWVHYVHAAWSPRHQNNGSLRSLKAALARRSDLIAERQALKQARLVIANSEHTRSVVVDQLVVPPERVRVIYYGSDPERFQPPSEAQRAEARATLGWLDDRPTLAFVGALGDLRKGFDTLLNAWTRLASDPSWNARLAVVGSGAALPFWKAQAAEAGLEGRSVEFLGFRADVPRILWASDGLVSPTRYEAYGLNVQEALCCGLPALVSASAGVAERYPPELSDWLISDAQDPAELADRIRLWRTDPGRSRPALRAVSEQLRDWTWDRMAGAILEEIEATSPGRLDDRVVSPAP